MDQLEKNKLISEKGKQTRVKRKTQVCKTFTFKVNKSSLTAEQKEWLTMIFVEAKWIYNYLVGLDDGSNICDARRYKELYHITHLDKDRNVIQCDITHLGSSMMQGVIDKIRYAISGLSKLKENGKQVGHLKFKTEFNTLFLKQYGITHKIVGPNKIKIQGCKRPIRVCGMKQMSKYKSIDYTTAEITFDGYDWHITLTCFIDKNETITSTTKSSTTYKNDIIGLDLGCSTTITTSLGEKYKVLVEETDKLKQLKEKRDKQERMSNNWKKTNSKIRKEYNRISNIKDDLAKQIVHKIVTNNKIVVTQDDDLSEWHKTKGCSKTVQHSILGRVKSLLKTYDNVVFLDKWAPTSKYCFECGNKHDHLTLDDRTFVCPTCGTTEDRDIHAAKNMILFFLENKHIKKNVGQELAEVKLELTDKMTSKSLSAKQENTTSSALC